ncbi:uncharacterized protein LOC141718998 [Apium graveolens]|uniref:uncharacterized protein LOC141718998 n=1 Tax=Apium graveolens TaxID=4045 RepID=UPI003D7927BB
MSNVDREENQWADSLDKLASSNLPVNISPIYVDVLATPSIDEVSVNQIQTKLDWRQPFLDYIIDNKLPEHKTEVRALMFKARNYCVVGSALYRRALSEPLLCCLSLEEALQAIVEIHTRICGEHLGGKSLALKVIRQDIVGPFPKSKKQCQYIVVAVDYATKWVEAKPLSKIREKEMIEFFMEYIVFRFGIPRILVFDNGTQFVGKQFEKALLELKIQHIKASVAYPQANGLAEVTNRTILQGETPFRLAYGVDAVIPVEISLTSPRVDVFDPVLSLEGLRLHNDLLEETREEDRMRMVAQQEKTARYFNKKVKPKDLKVDDLVLRNSATSQPTVSGKFKPTWEGPYRISKELITLRQLMPYQRQILDAMRVVGRVPSRGG